MRSRLYLGRSALHLPFLSILVPFPHAVCMSDLTEEAVSREWCSAPGDTHRQRRGAVFGLVDLDQKQGRLRWPLQWGSMRSTRRGTLADVQALTPEALLLAREAVQERRKALGGALAALEPDERRVIALRFGLEGEAQSVTEVARVMGWSAPRVRQVEAGALAALRAGMGVEGIAG